MILNDEIRKKKNPAVINIYNFIRKTVYPSGEFIQDDFETVLYQIETINQYGLPATYALKYDALMDSRYSNLIKENLNEYDEVGAWWEIDKQLAEKAGVTWKGKTPVDDHVNIGYSLGYEPEERIKMVDVYMKDFKEIFGHFPKTVGSWVIDIVTLKYMKEKYNVIGSAICRDQIGTDGFTLWGGYYNQAYYPSKVNEYIPAQNLCNQLEVPIFRMLGPDPIYAFEDKLRKNINEVYTLEPASRIGQNKQWINWFFERLTDEENLGFSYAQTGQENTFLWNTMHKGYKEQISQIALLEKEGKVRVETLEESSLWFRSKYKLTPPTTFVASKDWNVQENLKTVWYNSRFYRVSFLFDNNELSIRDLHLFDENYISRYYTDSLENDESVFDALPILNAHCWSDNEKRAAINLVKFDNESIEGLKCDEPEFSVINDLTYKIDLKVKNQDFNIICKENSIKFQSEKIDGIKWAIHINKIPVLVDINKNEIICKHNNFIYKLIVNNGVFKKNNDSSILIIPNNDFLEIYFNEKYINKEADDVYRHSYVKNSEEIDNFIPKYKRKSYKKVVKGRAFKPIVNSQAILSSKPINEKVSIKNPNNEGNIYYTLDGSIPDENSYVYKQPIIVESECTIKAVAITEKLKPSEIVEINIYGTLPIKDIIGFSDPTEVKKYNKNGVYDLIDGKKGSKDYTDGCWLGYTDDLNVVVDLGEIIDIKNIMIGFLQDTRAWIYFPQYVRFYVSTDGKKFELLDEIKNIQSNPRKEVEVKNIKVSNDKPIRYIRVFAKNEELCPKWSIMAGEGPAFMFADQITVE